MTKKDLFKTVTLSVVVTFVIVILFSRYITAAVSTIPLLNRWRILAPQAPIVITQRQEIRVNNTQDLQDAENTAKSRISAVVVVDNGSTAITGNAINVTSDGTFLTTTNVFAQQNSTYFIVLNDGRSAKITTKVTDPATGMVFFKAALDNVPVANFGSSKDLQPGDKLVFLAASAKDNTPRFLTSFVTVSQNDVENRQFETDRSWRQFGAQGVAPLVNGHAVVNMKGEVVGMWDSDIVSSDVIRHALDLYFSGKTQITRPSYGFSYTMITKNQSALLGLPEGAEVKNVVGPAAVAGLKIGDVITTVGDSKITENNLLEEALEQYKPGDVLKLTVARNKQNLTLNLTAGTIK